jgi:hypothetical protein
MVFFWLGHSGVKLEGTKMNYPRFISFSLLLNTSNSKAAQSAISTCIAISMKANNAKGKAAQNNRLSSYEKRCVTTE